MFVYSLLSSSDNFKCAIEARNKLSTPDILHIEIVEKNEARKSEVHSNNTKTMFANKYKSQKHSNKPTQRKDNTRVNDKKSKLRCSN